MRHVIPLLLLAVPLLAGEDGDAENPPAKIDVGDLVRRLGSRDADEQLAAARVAATVQDAKVLAPLIRLLKDKNPAARTAAVEALALRQDPKHRKGAATALAARLDPLSTKEGDKPELLAVVQALHDLAQPATIHALLDVRSGTERDVVRARAMAVGNVPSKEAIERLITFGYKDRRGSDSTRQAAVQALAYATQETRKGGIEVWRKWWSENEKTFDPVAAAEKRREGRGATADKEQRRKERRAERKKKQGGDAGGED